MLPGVGSDFGRYRITGRLGRGGMGVVFSAVHRDLDRPVALKLLAPELSGDDSYRNRFLREARIMARLDSPFVVRVYDTGEQDGWLFIATQMVDGGDLKELIDAEGPLPIDAAVELVAEVAEGLAVAHEAGILHRDIKPSNVLLRQLPDGRRQAVLCDLGIAVAADVESTQTVGVIGTPTYMAPERHQGEDATVASDIYAVGCLLWAAITGGPPYQGTGATVFRGHVHGALPQLPGATVPEVAVNTILQKAMAKSPADRFASAQALATALRDRPTESAPSTELSSRTEEDVEPQPTSTAARTFALSDLPVPPREGASVAEPEPPTEAPARPPAREDQPVSVARRADPPVGRGRRWAWAALASVLVLGVVATVVALALAPGRDGPDPAAADQPASASSTPPSEDPVNLTVPRVSAIGGVGKVQVTWDGSFSAEGARVAAVQVAFGKPSHSRSFTFPAARGTKVVTDPASRASVRARVKAAGVWGPWTAWLPVPALGSPDLSVSGSYRSVSWSWSGPRKSHGVPVKDVEVRVAPSGVPGTIERHRLAGDGSLAELDPDQSVTVSARLVGPGGVVGPWREATARTWPAPTWDVRQGAPYREDGVTWYPVEFFLQYFAPGSTVSCDHPGDGGGAFGMDANGGTGGWIFAFAYDDRSNARVPASQWSCHY